MRGKRGRNKLQASSSKLQVRENQKVGTGLVPVRPKIRGNLRSRFFWNLYARCYDSIYHLMPYRKLLWDTYQALDLKPEMKILDAGCGTGNFELFTSEKDPPQIKIEAIEPSPWRLSRAKKKCKKLDYVNFKLTDLNQKLDYSDNTFDRIVCLETLKRLENPRLTFQELNRALKPSGKLIMTESKPDAKTAPIAREQFKRIKNIWGIPRKSITFLGGIPRLPALKLASSLQNRFNSENGEENLVPLFKKSEFQGVNIAPSYADQSEFVHSVKNSSPQSQAVNNYPLIFKVAETNEEIEGAQRLRFKVFCEKKRYLDPARYSFGVEQDEYDPYSVHFIALNSEGKVIGTNRLILNSEAGFHIEKYFDIDIEGRLKLPRGCLAEMSRLTVEAEEINANDPVAFGLYKISYDFSIEHGITHWLAILDEALYRVYKYIGFIFNPIGEPKNCLGGITAPYILSFSETAVKLERQNPSTYEFFTTPFGGIFNDELKRNSKYETRLRKISR